MLQSFAESFILFPVMNNTTNTTTPNEEIPTTTTAGEIASTSVFFKAEWKLNGHNVTAVHRFQNGIGLWWNEKSVPFSVIPCKGIFSENQILTR